MIFPGRKAYRYARALYEVASQQNLQAEIVAEMKEVVSLFSKVPQLQRIFAHRRISLARKLEVLDKALELETSLDPTKDETTPVTDELIRNFLTLVIKNNRVRLVEQIAVALNLMLDSELGVVEAKVVSAIALPDEQLADIEKVVLARTGAKRVELHTRVEKAWIAGLEIRIGDELIDATSRTYLEGMFESVKQYKVDKLMDSDFLRVDRDALDSAVEEMLRRENSNGTNR